MAIHKLRKSRGAQDSIEYARLGKLSLGLALIGIFILWIPVYNYYLSPFFGLAAIITGVVSLWKSSSTYAGLGLILGVLLIIFWPTIVKEFYRYW